MVRIYNVTEDSYLTIEQYIDNYSADDEDVYYVQFAFSLETLFTTAKKLSALRGKNAYNGDGKSLLEVYALGTDDEDFFDSQLQSASSDLYSKLLAWTKDVFKSYRYKELLDIGDGEENTLVYFINIPDSPYFDLFETAAVKMAEALVAYTMAEWYKVNRLMDDYTIEAANYEKKSREVKSQLMQKATPTRRSVKLIQ